MNRSKDWLRQAQEDLKFANASIDLEHYNQTCFIAQQAAEKALKALAFKKGAQYIKSDSVKKIAKDLGFPSDLIESAQALDQYYLSLTHIFLDKFFLAIFMSQHKSVDPFIKANPTLP